MAISLMGGIVLIVLHSMWAMGAMPGFEGQGFVQKSEFQQLARDVRVSRKNTLRSAIVDIIKNACQAPPGPYRTTLINQKTALLSEWKDLTGTDFPAPDCKEMGL